jgi:integrase
MMAHHTKEQSLHREISADFALKCTDHAVALSSDLERLVAAATSSATRRAYQSDLRLFLAWGGKIPSAAEIVAEYVAALALSSKPATIARKLASISKAHQTAGHASPVGHQLVKLAMRGVRREQGVSQTQAKPILKSDLVAMLDAQQDGLRGIRDRAILLVGFASGCRRSEIVALDLDDIKYVQQGLVVTLRRSKTDQDGVGREIGIPFGRSAACPVSALKDWIKAGQIAEGPIFRPIDRHSNISSSRLTADAVAKIVKQACVQAGFDPRAYSGHSLRAGLATSAAMAGIPLWKIRQQTGHASDAMVSRYVRNVGLFVDNAAGSVL